MRVVKRKNGGAMKILLIPSHEIASWLLALIGKVLTFIGVEDVAGVEEIVYLGLIIVLAVGIGWLSRWIFVLVASHTSLFKRWTIGREFVEQRVVSRCSHIIPPLIFLAFIPFAFEEGSRSLVVANELAGVYLLITIGIALCAILEFLWTHYDRHRNTRNLPLRGILNVGRAIVWLLVAIISVSVLIDKSPVVLLTGLGAFAAAMMFVFKDALMGLVAGIQISQNDMLRVGDWIVVPTTIANGIVESVTLSVVKIRNWDNTIVTMPPYTLVSTSFQNWRGMSDSKVRLISRSIVIDATSVKPCSPRVVDDIVSRVPLLQEFIDAGSTTYGTGLTPVNGSLDTNLGLLRAYVCMYLKRHPMVAGNQQILARLMEQTENGIPLQVYCYAATTDWAAYESIQSEIVEHIVSICPTMYLSVYNSVAGKDLNAILQ